MNNDEQKKVEKKERSGDQDQKRPEKRETDSGVKDIHEGNKIKKEVKEENKRDPKVGPEKR